MAVVHPLRPVGAEVPDDPDRGNGLPFVEVLGPISPELALVDPDVARRARALLSETFGAQASPLRERLEPSRLSLSAPQARRKIRRRLLIAAVVGATAATAAVGWWTASMVLDGNRSPGLPAGESSGSGSPVVLPPRFVWLAEPGAVGYRFALYRDGNQVFERDVKTAALQLPRSWTYDGRFYGVTKGTYRWIVWPLIGSGDDVRPGPPIVSADYTL